MLESQEKQIPRCARDDNGVRERPILDVNAARAWLSCRAILKLMAARVARIDHIQLAAPEGCEQAAREFYGSILGLREIEKPPALAARGGCWFECGSQQVHIGVEKQFQPARKGHPAFAVPELDGLRKSLIARGTPVVDDDNLPGERRFYAEDPWGNRLEFIEARPPDAR